MNEEISKLIIYYYYIDLVTTGGGKTILAEFDFNGNPLETFPFNQAKERRFSFFLKKYIMPDLYWFGLLKGYWNGPGFYSSYLLDFLL